jgi:hypothetical protein
LRTLLDGYERGAEQLARVLRGGSPAELAFQPPTCVEMHVNRKAARAIRIDPPRVVLLQAGKVIDQRPITALA